MKIIRWTFWGDPIYPEAEWSLLDEHNPYELELIKEIREKGYRLTGIAHQNYRYGVPVFDDGKQFNVSMRYWGNIMAKALGIDGEDGYREWAWTPPKTSEHFPKPSEWNESPEESEEQEKRFDKYIHDELMRDLRALDELELKDAKEKGENGSKNDEEKNSDTGVSKS